MTDYIYLIDADAFFTPSKNYYRFSIAPSYWMQFNDLAEKGYIKTIDKIEKEIRPRKKDALKDDIQLWYENDFKGEVLSTEKQEIVSEYINILQFLHENPKYSDKAFNEWSARVDIADPWLIATAKVYGYTVITFERMIIYNGGSPMGEAKIPNVCEDVNVKCTDLFTMMEQLKIKL